MPLYQIWLLRAALVALALLCFTFGALTLRKGLRVVWTRNIDNVVHGGPAEEFGAYSVFLGGFVFLFGFALLYFLSMF